jgi:hypothetical protein
MSTPESLKMLKILNTSSSVFNTYGASGSATFLPRINMTPSDNQRRHMSRSMSWGPLSSMSSQLNTSLKPSFSSLLMSSGHTSAFGSHLPTTQNTNIKAGRSASELYRTTQKELGEFYATASGVLITPDKKAMKSNNFTQTFETSGMYRDSSLQSPFIQKMRRKYHREYVKKRALDKEAFVLRQKVAVEEKKARRDKERERRRQKFLKRQNSATAIQCMVRSSWARRETAYRRNKAQHRAASKMQKMWYNMKACRGAISEKVNRRRNRAAIRVQTVARRRQAKKIVNQKFIERDEHRELLKQKYVYEQARNIQKVYRGFRDRQFVNRKLEQKAKFRKMKGGKKRGKKK